MNHSELADLLAQTHHSTIRPHSSYVELPPNSPLSPRQRFQCQIRTLGDDGTPDSSPQPSSLRRNNELQHISSLRVQPSSPRAVERRSKHSKSIEIAPDFGFEESVAWNRRSPNNTPDHVRKYQVASEQNYVLRSPDVDGSLAEESPRPPSPLREFRPLQNARGSNDRPKTSRGSKPTITGASQYEERQKHKSKFLEGSMNDRSVGISSTWTDDVSITSTEDDSDMTPRASEVSQTSRSSIDLSDFRPQSSTATIIKKRFSKLTSPFKSSEDKNKSNSERPQSPTKSLRKAKSTWNFKFFGSSTDDISAEANSLKQTMDEEANILDERKRKAEEAYGRQFGFKKQKSNSGLAGAMSPTKVVSKIGSVRRRSLSGNQTITAATNTRKRRVSSADTITKLQDPADLVQDNDIDHQKLPSRRELEKENQQLRAMLREQQKKQVVSGPTTRSMTASSAKSSNTKSSSHQSYTWNIESTSPVKQLPNPTKNIPLLPAHPKRAALSNLSNVRNHTNVSDTGTMKRVRSGARSVPIILEEEEDNENKKPHVTKSSVRREERWEWPEDVF